ncbi:acylphosphatase-1-like isoform X2 [Diadema setosum]|uniref:acylphosphatase-1-like isoform X2 n=1 Tax=Diadema setosum TaxID=31175 RepID=UPI003B3BBEB5
MASAITGRMALKSIDFEIFGKVQGVFFRKHTRLKAKEYNLTGWVQNTSRGTVIGQAQGPIDKISQMKKWLRTKGSPKSRIDKAVFSNEQEIETLTFQTFDIIR